MSSPHSYSSLCLISAILVLLPFPPGIYAAEESSARSESRRADELTQLKVAEPKNERGFLKILDALRWVGASTRDWKDLKTACDVQGRLADLLWDIDHESAKSYLLQAWETSTGIKDDSNGSLLRNSRAQDAVRREILMIARKRDPRLSDLWLAQIADSDSKKENELQSPRGVFDDRTRRSSVLLQMAYSSLETNPEAAARLASDSLQDGISYGFQQVLLGLQRSNPIFAENLFRAGLSRLTSFGMVDPTELLTLASFLFTPGVMFLRDNSADRATGKLILGKDMPPSGPLSQTKPDIVMEFLSVAGSCLLRAPWPRTTFDPQQTARSQINTITALMGYFSQYRPDLAVSLHGRVLQLEVDASLTSSAASESAPENAKSESFRILSPEEAFGPRFEEKEEEKASLETDPLKRDLRYAELALKMRPEKYSSAYRLAKNIKDAPLQDNVINSLTFRAALHLLNAGQIDLGHELNSKNNDFAQRAVCLVVGARKLTEARQVERARDWLQEAWLLKENSRPEDCWVKILLGISSTYSIFDPDAAVGALSEAISLLGRFPLSDLTDQAAPQIRRVDGFKIPNFPYRTEGFGLESALEKFGMDQFDNVFERLKAISSPEVQGFAILTLCRRHIVAKVSSARRKGR